VSYFYLVSGGEDVRELAALELWLLAGTDGEGACLAGPVAADVTGAAYTRFCAELIAEGPDLEALVAATAAAAPRLEGFNLHLWRPAPRATDNPLQAIRRLADAIPGQPNLDHPRHRLAVVAQADWWRLGRVVSVASGDWRAWTPPVDFSAALPPQLARALVNLVAAPGDTLLDPCCGVGTVVAQAARRGVRAVGVEISKKLAGRAAECVRAAYTGETPVPPGAGHPGTLIVAGDGREIGGRFDAAVVDLPYGRSSVITPGLYRDLLGNLRGLVQRAAIVAAYPLDEVLAEAGFRLLRLARARSGGLVRHVHLVVPEGGAGRAEHRPAVLRESGPEPRQR
jgi:hypothetical protein